MTLWKRMLTITIAVSFVCFGDAAFAQQDGRAGLHTFPQIVDGRLPDGTYYRSAIYISNPNTDALRCSVELYGMRTTFQDTAGSVFDGGRFNVVLQGNASTVLRTSGSSSFQAGYAVVVCTLSPFAVVMLSNSVVVYGFYAPNGTKLSEATVFSSPRSQVSLLIADQRDSAKLGIAIANDNDSAASAGVVATNLLGDLVASTPLIIPMHSQYAKFINELLPTLPNNFVGHINVVSVSDQLPLAVIGLRFTGTAFTTIPAAVRSLFQ